MGIQTAARELRSKMRAKTRRVHRVHWPLLFSDFNQNLNIWRIFRGDKTYRRKVSKITSFFLETAYLWILFLWSSVSDYEKGVVAFQLLHSYAHTDGQMDTSGSPQRRHSSKKGRGLHHSTL